MYSSNARCILFQTLKWIKAKNAYCNCFVLSRYINVSNQGSDDAFSSCDFEQNCVCMLNDNESGTVCGLQQHATCV